MLTNFNRSIPLPKQVADLLEEWRKEKMEKVYERIRKDIELREVEESRLAQEKAAKTTAYIPIVEPENTAKRENTTVSLVQENTAKTTAYIPEIAQETVAKQVEVVTNITQEKAVVSDPLAIKPLPDEAVKKGFKEGMKVKAVFAGISLVATLLCPNSLVPDTHAKLNLGGGNLAIIKWSDIQLLEEVLPVTEVQEIAPINESTPISESAPISESVPISESALTTEVTTVENVTTSNVSLKTNKVASIAKNLIDTIKNKIKVLKLRGNEIEELLLYLFAKSRIGLLSNIELEKFLYFLQTNPRFSTS